MCSTCAEVSVACPYNMLTGAGYTYTSIHRLLVCSDPWQVAMMLLNNILESAPEPVSVATPNHMYIT